MVRRSEIEKGNADLQRANDELDRLRVLLEASAPMADLSNAKAQLDSATETILSQQLEIEQLKKRMEGMSEVIAPSIEKLSCASGELDRLRRELGMMVSRAQLDAAKDSIRSLEAEVERLKKLDAGVVSKVELDKGRAEISSASGEPDRLRRELGMMVSRAQLDAAESSIQSLEAEVERLKKLDAGVVWKVELDKGRAEISSASRELYQLKKELGMMVAKANDSARSPQAEVGRTQGQREVRALREELAASRTESKRLAGELERLRVAAAAAAAVAAAQRQSDSPTLVRGVGGDGARPPLRRSEVRRQRRLGAAEDRPRGVRRRGRVQRAHRGVCATADRAALRAMRVGATRAVGDRNGGRSRRAASFRGPESGALPARTLRILPGRHAGWFGPAPAARGFGY